MAAKRKQVLFLSLSLLGLNFLLSFFELVIAAEKSFKTLDENEKYNLPIDDFSRSPSYPLILGEEFTNKDSQEDIILKLNIFSDQQYDFNQSIYIAEGNVKATINGGILRSDLLKFDRSSGLLSAEGNVSFRKRGQYFRGKEFQYNLINKAGVIRKPYGILDIKNLAEDLNIDPRLEKLKSKNISDQGYINKKNFLSDGVEFSLGNILIPVNKITRSDKLIGSINNWRFKTDLIIINENGWTSDKMYFTNDPFDPTQISIEAINVVAIDDDKEDLIITASKTNLILEGIGKFPLGKKRFTTRKNKKSKYELMIDRKDRDGLVIIRRNDDINLNKNINIALQPQLLIQRAFMGETNSYDNKSIKFSDLFGLKLKINLFLNEWKFESLNDLSTFNTSRIFDGFRHSSLLKRSINSTFFDNTTINAFTTYRYRAWNGTLGETEIKSAYGGFVEKNKQFNLGPIYNNLNLRLGTAKYEAEKLINNDIERLWRSSIFSSIDSFYPIWISDKINSDQEYNMIYSPIPIQPELTLRTNINSAYYKYEDGSDQGFIKFSIGPEIRLGNLERNFFDYTKIAIMPGIKVKSGNSPFKFDNAIDLKTINLSLVQQVYGALMLDIESNINIDNRSNSYGEYFDTKLGIMWQKRAYEFGIYYHPSNDSGGLYFRLNGFNFSESTNPIF